MGCDVYLNVAWTCNVFVWRGECKPTIFSVFHPYFYMRCAKVPNLRSFQNGLISLSRSSTRRRYSPILGITSWYQSLLQPRSPHCLIESLTVESRHTLKTFWVLYLYRRVGFLLLLISFHSGEDSWRLLLSLLLSKIHQIFFRITRVLFGLFRCLCDENIVLDASCH